VSDEVRRLSDELARDPASLVFLPLGEVLRRQGQLDIALKVAVRGLERHPHNADAHDLLARIAVDRGELERAFDEWDMVLRFAPGHSGAKRGMGFVCFRQGRLEDAERYLAEALEADAGDQSTVAALATVRRSLGRPMSEMPAHAPTPVGVPPVVPARPVVRESAAAADHVEITNVPNRQPAPAAPDDGPAWLAHTLRTGAASPPPTAQPQASTVDARDREALTRGPRALFADLIGDADQTALLLDADGFVLAGAYLAPDGRDVAQEVGAELSGVSDEAQRAMRHLDLGDWSQIIVETEVASVALAPAALGGLLLVAADRAMPLGSVRRFLDRALARSKMFVGGGA
jgi:predicted regulator of Ras-like GTPase activity (Roadblock/LC7/MglB family)